jgi:predicted NBD/HSP70 family sugar kinase
VEKTLERQLGFTGAVMGKLKPNETGKYLIGVDIGATNVRAGLVDFKGKVLAEARRPARAPEGMKAAVEIAI